MTFRQSQLLMSDKEASSRALFAQLDIEFAAAIERIKAYPINIYTADHIISLADSGGIVEMNLAGPNTVTVPPHSVVPQPVGTRIQVVQFGVGQTTIVAGVGVTLRSVNGLVFRESYAAAFLYQRRVDDWVVTGSGNDLTSP